MEFVKEEVYYLVSLTRKDINILLSSVERYKYSDSYLDTKTLDEVDSIIEFLLGLEAKWKSE